jgi:hypothetical protein
MHREKNNNSFAPTTKMEGIPQSNVNEKRAAAIASQQSSTQSPSRSEPLSLLERRLSGRTGSSGVTFIDKRIGAYLG